MPQRIGILGGTFNPIHVGHLAMAQTALEEARLDLVYFVPCFVPPHKRMAKLVSGRDRLAMVRQAVQRNPAFMVSDCEIIRQGKSYSVDTARYFQDRFPKAKLFWIIGADSFQQLPTWKAIAEIRTIVTFIVVNRPGYRPSRSALPHVSVTMPGIDIASSYLRRELARGKTIKYLVPDAVIRYIVLHRLYR